MSNPIYFKRGLKASLPTLAVGEPAFTTDNKSLYVGSGSGNIEFAKKSDITFETAGGTSTAITLTLDTLVNGYSKTFIASASNSSAATTVNGSYPLYKPGTTTAPNIISGHAYTIWYNLSSNAFFCKASHEGTAVASNVLATKTFSNDSDVGLTGTMLNNGALGTVLAINGTYTIPAGYTTGGTVTQSITTKAAATIIPGTSNQTIAANQYLTGAQTIAGDANLIASNIANGISIFGITGTLNSGGYVSGTGYTSVAAANSTHSITIDCGFQPSVVIIYDSYDNSYSTAYTNTKVNNLYCPGANIDIKVGVYLESLSITSTGFTGSDTWNRPGGDVIHWICFR